MSMTYAEARIHELVAMVVAARIRVDAMLAENAERERHGFAATWDAASIDTKATEIEGFARDIRDFAEIVT